MRFIRIPVSICVVLLALALVACAGSSTPTDSTAASAAASAAGIGQLGGVSVAASETASAAGGGAAQASPSAASATAAPSAAASIAPAAVGESLQAVRERGLLVCGVNDQLPGFGSVGTDGSRPALTSISARRWRRRSWRSDEGAVSPADGTGALHGAAKPRDRRADPQHDLDDLHATRRSAWTSLRSTSTTARA